MTNIIFATGIAKGYNIDEKVISPNKSKFKSLEPAP